MGKKDGIKNEMRAYARTRYRIARIRAREYLYGTALWWWWIDDGGATGETAGGRMYVLNGTWDIVLETESKSWISWTGTRGRNAREGQVGRLTSFANPFAKVSDRERERRGEKEDNLLNDRSASYYLDVGRTGRAARPVVGGVNVSKKNNCIRNW